MAYNISQEDWNKLAHSMRRSVELIDNATITINDVDVGLTRNQLAILVNRYYGETRGAGSPSPLAES